MKRYLRVKPYPKQSSIETIACRLYEIGAIQFGHFTLKSGQTSTLYIDLRRIISFPELLQQITAIMWEKIHTCQFDLVCGVPYTALPIATCMSLQHNIPMIMRRKEKKSYGTRQMIEGVYQAGQTCLVLEDIITTGGSILTTIDDLAACQILVKDIIVLLDRTTTSTEVADLSRYRVHSVLTMNVLLQILMDAFSFSTKENDVIQSLLEKV